MAAIGFFPKICDAYTDNVYCYICDSISKVTALVTFALGEILMYAGVFGAVLCIIFSFLLIFLKKKERYRKFCTAYLKTMLMALVITVFVYMPTWFIPFRGTVLGEGDVNKRTEFTNEELAVLFKYTVDGANAAAEEIEIGADGTVEFPSEDEIQKMSVEAMQSISGEFPRLEGFYPPVKTALCSDILEYMGIGGYNYPYTMEPTHNKYFEPMYQALLDSHELAHHKGYYKENEANFLSMLALSKSDDPYLRLSGYYEMHWYLIDDFYEDALYYVGDEPMLNERVEFIINALVSLQTLTNTRAL